MIGRLRHRITIEEMFLVPDGTGGFSESWQAVATAWAEVKPMNARERFFAEKLEANITHRVTIRFRSGIDESMRVAFDSRILKIQGIINAEERGKFLELLCEEGSGS